MSNTPRNVYKSSSDSAKQKLNNSNENEAEKLAIKKNTWSVIRERESGNAAAILFNSNNGPNENKEKSQQLTPPNLQEINKEKYICVQMQFKAKTKEKNEVLKHKKNISNLLYKFMKGVQKIYNKASLLPWRVQSPHILLNGNELRLHVGEKVNKYINIPELKDNLIE